MNENVGGYEMSGGEGYSKTIGLLRTAGKIYFYLYEYEERDQNMLIKYLKRDIDLLFRKDISFLDKVRIVYAELTRKHSKKGNQIEMKYLNTFYYSRRVLLKTIFNSFGFSEFITLSFSEGDSNYNEAMECFFRNCREIFYKNHCRLDKLLGDNDVIIDGGGNMGLFSLYAKNLKKKSLVLYSSQKYIISKHQRKICKIMKILNSLKKGYLIQFQRECYYCPIMF